MSNMGDSTSAYSTYGQPQPPQAPMPPGMQPGYQQQPLAQPHQQHRTSRVTRPTWATTELIAYVVTVIGVLLASAIISDSSARGDQDSFRADQAWFYITILTVGYMLSKGIAKAGKDHNQYDENSRF